MHFVIDEAAQAKTKLAALSFLPALMFSMSDD